MRNTGSMWLRTLRARLTGAAEEALELNTRTHTHAHNNNMRMWHVHVHVHNMLHAQQHVHVHVVVHVHVHVHAHAHAHTLTARAPQAPRKRSSCSTPTRRSTLLPGSFGWYRSGSGPRSGPQIFVFRLALETYSTKCTQQPYRRGAAKTRHEAVLTHVVTHPDFTRDHTRSHEITRDHTL